MSKMRFFNKDRFEKMRAAVKVMADEIGAQVVDSTNSMKVILSSVPGGPRVEVNAGRRFDEVHDVTWILIMDGPGWREDCVVVARLLSDAMGLMALMQSAGVD